MRWRFFCGASGAADRMCCSERHVYRLMINSCGIGPKEYAG